MRAIVNTGPGRLELQDWPIPVPGQGQVRIKTLTCGICTTDLKMITGWQRTGFPAIPGHEWAGQVDTVGPDVDPGLVGRRCVAENVLADGGEVGFEHPGGYAEYLLTEAGNLYPLPADFPMHTAALIEPLAVAVHGKHRLRLPDAAMVNAPALILGDGPMGLLMLLLLKEAGIREVDMVGGWPNRLGLAKELGAAHLLDFQNAEDDLPNKLGRQYPVIVEASGSGQGMATALRQAARCGRVLVLGDYEEARADFRWNAVLHQEIELIGSNASAGAWPEAVRLATQGHLPLDRLITYTLPPERVLEGIDITTYHKNDCMKVVIDWQ